MDQKAHENTENGASAAEKCSRRTKSTSLVLLISKISPTSTKTTLLVALNGKNASRSTKRADDVALTAKNS
jgi:hypothetical protein